MRTECKSEVAVAQSPEHRRFMDTYLNAVGQPGGDRFALKADEFAWVVNHATEWNAVRLRLLAAIQHALPASQSQDKAAQELKETLTNVIIMQTRLREREEALVRQVEGAVKAESLGSVPVNPADIRAAATLLMESERHLHNAPR